MRRCRYEGWRYRNSDGTFIFLFKTTFTVSKFQAGDSASMTPSTATFRIMIVIPQKKIMEFKDTLNYRQSIRIFKDKTIPKDDLRDIIRLAEKAPSWTNSQPWRVHIATGESLQKIKEDHLRHYELGIHGKPDFPYAPRDSWDQLSQLNSFKWSSELGSFLGEDSEQMGYSNTHLFDATAIVYLTLPKKGSIWSIYDLGAFGQTLALTAADKRIDSVVAYEFY